jgi:hypothetical protein
VNQIWSWVLTAVGVSGLYLAGRRSWAGWAIGLGAQVLWLAYAIATRQWGFIVSAFAYGSVYATNVRRWRREKKTEEEAPCMKQCVGCGVPLG